MKQNHFFDFFVFPWRSINLKFWILFFGIFFIVFSVKARNQTIIPSNPITCNLQSTTIEDFIELLRSKSSFRFMYNTEILQNKNPISIVANNKELLAVLEEGLNQVALQYEVIDDVILIRATPDEPVNKNKQVTLQGLVTDIKGNPLPGATIIIKGSIYGVATDEKGRYTLTIDKASDDVLIFSFIGMISQEIKYRGQKELNVSLKEQATEMDEVVVNGYFARKKESFTGVSKTFSGSELRSVSTGDLLNTLSILDPSFTKIVNNEMGSDPNALPSFEIRGSSSLKGEFGGKPNMPTFIMDGFEVSAQKVFDLDPSRVRFMTILKDAAATAIYGSRAANGVVVIETFLPKPGKLRVSYNGSVNFEIADLSDYDLMNAEEKLNYEVLANLYPQTNQPQFTDDNLETYNEKLRLVKQGNDIDWLSIPIRDVGIGSKHSLIAEGGYESFRYALSLSYSNKVGVMKGSNRNTYGGAIQLQYNLKKIKFSNYTSFDHLKSNNSPYGKFNSYLNYNPYYNPYDENGNIKKILYSYIYYDRGFLKKEMYNALYNATLPFKDEAIENNFLNNFSIEYDILPSLKLKSNISLSVENRREDLYKAHEHLDFAESTQKGSYDQTITNRFSYDINTILTYIKSIQKHFLNLGAVFNLREETLDMSSLRAVGFPNINMDHISMGANYPEGSKPGGTYDITRLIGFVGNIGYSYDNRFLLDASVRSDGSSLYGVNNRWSTFWSVGLGYNLHNETWFKSLHWINMLKIRGSLGTSGGQNFNPYQAMAMYSYNDPRINGISYGNYVGTILKAFGNKNLKWQKIEKRNIGLDIEMWNSRVSATVDYYTNLSKDVLVDVTLAPSLGFDSYKENLGKVENNGFEITVKSTLIQNVKNNLRWDIMLNAAHNVNKVKEISSALTAFNAKQDSKVTNRPTIRYQEGKSQNTIWANESLGIDPATGEEIFLDMNGKKVDKWSSANYKPFGSTDPKMFGTIGTIFMYRGLEINAYLYYKYGGYIYNQTLIDKVENVNPNENGDRRILYDRWQKPGDIAKYKKVSDVSETKPTSRFIEKENLIQLQSVSIGYDFRSKGLERIGIERLKLTAIGNDLFTFSTVKMERGIYYPFARTFSLSAQITF